MRMGTERAKFPSTSKSVPAFGKRNARLDDQRRMEDCRCPPHTWIE